MTDLSNTTETTTDTAIEQKRTKLQNAANDLILIAQSQSNTALNLLHKISVLGGTTEKAYQAVQQRILDDGDIHGAYHAIAMVQQTPDVPFDIPPLVNLILHSQEKDKNALLMRLLKLFDTAPLDAPPIPQIKAAIEATGDTDLIVQFQQHLAGK